MQLNPSEISELIKSKIQNLDTGAEVRTQGTVVSVSDGICRIHGLSDAMAAAIDNPKLGADQKEALFLSVCGDRLNAIGRNFIKVLVEADRIVVLLQIEAMFAQLKNAAEGVAKAEIVSAIALTDQQVGELKVVLEKRFGKKIEASVSVDPSLIGGARIVVGDQVVDGSIAGKLQAMATQLKS